MAFKLKKRRKSRRLRGSKSQARGFKKKARGSGHRGGVGMAGTGKRGDQLKTYVLNLFGNDYFGKDRALRRGNKPAKLKSINLQQISDNIHSLLNKKTNEINLSGYKILGEGHIKEKLTIKADAASESAMEKIKKSGSTLVLKDIEEEKKEAKK
jgi:large subunit ribosomal protein L15